MALSETKKVITRSEYDRDQASNAILKEWSNDPNTANREECAFSLKYRLDMIERERNRNGEILFSCLV